MKSKRELVQVKNPKTGWYTKIDKTNGLILGTKRIGGPYVGIPIAKRKPAGTWHKNRMYGTPVDPSDKLPKKGGVTKAVVAKVVKEAKKKMREVQKPVGKPESFTSAQAKKAIRKISAKRSKAVEYVVLKDIIIPKGTVLTLAASEVSRVEPHFDNILGFGDNSCGEFCISVIDMEEAPDYFIELKR